ncbi:MAG: hypothetical protein OIN66_16280 [Candidatus Methanoperedens sp.]|nr:hypothetical protein [Candidatus Methanoperedens sp.]
MPKTSEPMRGENIERKDVFRIWADSYAVVSKMWEDSYENLYKPWIESTGTMLDKTVELSKEPTPERYRDFFNEWLRTYKNTFGKIYPVPTRKADKETLEKLVSSAEETKNLFQSWANMLDENARKTKELLEGAPDPEKYREFYDLWMKTYGRIFEEFLEMPAKGSVKEVFEGYGGVPSIYLRNFVQMSRLWRDAYMNLYMPWVDSMTKLSGKMMELSRGEASPEAYREFYHLWMSTYRDTFGRLFAVESTRPTKEMMESFLRSTDVYLNMYKSWTAALEKMSERTADLSKRTVDPEAYREFYSTWVKMNERAIDDFFRYMPAVGPMKNMMEPVKNAARAYTDMFVNMSNAWMRMVPSAGAASTASQG